MISTKQSKQPKRINSMNLNNQLFNIYEQLKPLVSSNFDLHRGFESIQENFEYKKNNPDVSIMVYGVYNAGKSTLINALVGHEVAATGDIPLTDTITEYVCRNYKILDTPGIDAPKEHEQVTQEILGNADAVIFVVNPLGVVEEEKTLSTLMDLLQFGKKVFLVFNEKNQLTEEDFIKLKDQTRIRLQDLALERNLGQVLKDIPIIKVNAKMAFDGKQKEKEKLIEYSGYYIFEKELDEFIQNISEKDIFARLKLNLIDFLNQSIQDLEKKSNNELVKQYDVVVTNLSKNKVSARKEINTKIDLSEKELYSQIKFWIYNETEQTDVLLQNWITDKSNLLSLELNGIIEECIVKVNDDIEQLKIKLPTGNVNNSIEDLSNITIKVDQQEVIQNGASINQDNNVYKDQLQNIANLGQHIKAEHIALGLNVIKQHLPSLMKGIGPKTIEKLAGQMASKAIPMIGAVITIGLALKDILSEDAETAHLKRQQELEQRARERREQQIEDSAVQISSQFATSMRIGMCSAIDEFFNITIKDIESISQGFDQIDKENGQLMANLQEKVSLLR